MDTSLSLDTSLDTSSDISTSLDTNLSLNSSLDTSTNMSTSLDSNSSLNSSLNLNLELNISQSYKFKNNVHISKFEFEFEMLDFISDIILDEFKVSSKTNYGAIELVLNDRSISTILFKHLDLISVEYNCKTFPMLYEGFDLGPNDKLILYTSKPISLKFNISEIKKREDDTYIQVFSNTPNNRRISKIISRSGIHFPTHDLLRKWVDIGDIEDRPTDALYFCSSS